MPVLPVIPLYPKSTFLEYNVSLGIPGPKLYDIPVAGKYAEKAKFPNTKSSILFPDVDYIKKFAQYELGIADGILGAAKLDTNSTVKDPGVGDKFNKNFDFASQDGMGLKSLEKTIISSIFESQKPYFVIAQMAIEALVSIEDIMARTAPLIGAGINPPMALAIKSRKPIGNGPTEDNPLGLGKYGSPPAIGYKGGEEIRGKINEFRNVAKDGLNIDADGNVTEPLKPDADAPIINLTDYQYDYVTVSVAYSTGNLNNNIEYDYQYIDILEDYPKNEIPLQEPEIEEDIKPDRIILGIFNSAGVPINPKEKIEYFDVNGNNDLIKSQSIFEKANWVYQSDKWFFDKSVDFNNKYTWEILDKEQFHWKRSNELKIQNESPGGNGWTRLKWKDILNFSNPENEYLEYKKEDYVISPTEVDMRDYNRYYESVADDEMENQQVDPAKRPEIKKEVEKIYDDEKLKETLQNLLKFAHMKLVYYNGIDAADWTTYESTNAPTETFDDPLRKIFKPMLFNVGGENIWIDPETHYDYKVIRVDSVRRVDYKSDAKIKNSYIQKFVKNLIEFNVIDNNSNIDFNIEIKKNGSIDDNVNNTLQHTLANWDFDNNIKVNNSYNFKVWLDKPSKRYNKTIKYGDKSDNYPGVRNNDNRVNNLYNKQDRISEETSYMITKSGSNFKYNKAKFQYFVDTKIDQDKAEAARALLIEAGLWSVINPVLSIQKTNQANALLAQGSTVTKNTHTEIIPLSAGSYLLPDGLEIEIDSNSNIKKWILYNSEVDINTEVDGDKILPEFFKKKKFDIKLDNMGNNKMNINPYIELNTEEISKFKAQLSENNIIPSVTISNDSLATNELFSKGKYGAGWAAGVTKDNDGNVVGTIEENPQKVGYKRRGQLTELDTETYFIIEGVKKTTNSTGSPAGGGSSEEGDDGNGFYFLPDALGIIPVVIKLAVSVFTELFPGIINLISLISNPMKFITDIITFKIKDPKSGFTIFSDKSLALLAQLPLLGNNFKAISGAVAGSNLSNYIFVKPDGDYKFLLDGPAVIDFFSLVFGINVALTDTIPITPIFGNVPKTDNLSEFLKNQKSNPITNDSEFSENDISITDNKKPIDPLVGGNNESIPNSVVSQVGKLKSYEEIYITYPDGKKEGMDYDYIYVNEEISILIEDANKLKDGDVEDMKLATQKLQKAMNLERDKGVVRDKGEVVDFDESKVNQPLLKMLQDEISSILEIVGIADQPIFKMILGVVTTPLKVVLGIIKELIDIFKKFLNPVTLPSALAEFLSFQWIMKFFDPMKLLALAGIIFDPKKAAEWCLAVNTPNPLYGLIPNATEYLIPDNFPIADLNQFLSVTFTATLPTYNAKQYRDMCLKPFRLFSPFICLIEQLINSFIMLVWAVMGIAAIIPPPFIKICQKLNENLSPEDASDILGGLYTDKTDFSLAGVDGKGGNGNTYDFIYEVKLPDGTIKRSLDAEELQKWLDENKDIEYDFSNFSTIE